MRIAERTTRLALFGLLGLGLRKSELGGIRVRDVDADRGMLRVFGKGQKERLLPLRGPILTELRLYLSTDLLHLGRPPQGDDFLLYVVPAARARSSRSAWAWHPRPKEPMSGPTLHRWVV